MCIWARALAASSGLRLRLRARPPHRGTCGVRGAPDTAQAARTTTFHVHRRTRCPALSVIIDSIDTLPLGCPTSNICHLAQLRPDAFVQVRCFHKTARTARTASGPVMMQLTVKAQMYWWGCVVAIAFFRRALVGPPTWDVALAYVQPTHHSSSYFLQSRYSVPRLAKLPRKDNQCRKLEALSTIDEPESSAPAGKQAGESAGRRRTGMQNGRRTDL